MPAIEQTRIIESIRERRRGFTQRFALQAEAEEGGEEAVTGER